MSLPAYLLPWSDVLTNGWPSDAGPAPDEAAVVKAVNLGAKPGDKNALAWAMYCRPDGATREEVSAACGAPQANRAIEFQERGNLDFTVARRSDGKRAYFLGKIGSNPGGPGAHRVGDRAPRNDSEDSDGGSIADRIRRYAVNNYITPAREQGKREVSIKAGALHDEMSLNANWANVCQTLEGAKFQNLANVPAPRRDGPQASPATVFVFQLAASEFTHDNVEKILREKYSPTSVQKKMVAFKLADGREIAFDREVRPAQVWVEAPSPIPQDFSSEIYAAERPRHHGLPPRLRHAGLPRSAARQVAKVSVLSLKQLEELLDWYAGQNVESDPRNFEEVAMPEYQAPSCTNLILYGPPGTGKTYATASEAVLLCNGSVPESRAELMEEYRKLMAAGRIEFVTFHQSYSYEEFVEGLRPSQGDKNSPGFSLSPEMGVFRKIARRAETSTGSGDIEFRIGDRQVFKMSIGEAADPEDAQLFEDALAGQFTLLGYDDIDWSDERFSSRDQIIIACAERDVAGAQAPTASSGRVQCPHIFRNWVKEKDLVVVSKGNSLFRAIGEIIGDYQYFPREDGTYSHRRAVRWLWHDRAGVPVEEIYNLRFIQKSIYLLTRGDLNIPALERYIASQNPNASGTPESFVLVIDEINRANISKVFGELITLLEADKRLGAENELKVSLPYSRLSFGVPANLHIVGTMNTADRSIALLDTALRRRFQFRELMPDPTTLSEASKACGVNLGSLLSCINERIEYLFDREHQIGHAYFIKCRSRHDVDEVMRGKVIPLLQEYFYEDWTKVAAVLGDIGGENGFLERRALPTPSGFEQGDGGGVRFTWNVRPIFAANCYDQLQ